MATKHDIAYVVKHQTTYFMISWISISPDFDVSGARMILLFTRSDHAAFNSHLEFKKRFSTDCLSIGVSIDLLRIAPVSPVRKCAVRTKPFETLIALSLRNGETINTINCPCNVILDTINSNVVQSPVRAICHVFIGLFGLFFCLSRYS